MSLVRIVRGITLLICLAVVAHGVAPNHWFSPAVWASPAEEEEAPEEGEEGFVPTIEYCTNCPPDLIVPHLFGGQDFAPDELVGLGASLGHFPPSGYWGGGLTPQPAPITTGSCICCACWDGIEDETGMIQYPPLDGPPTEIDCTTGTGLGGTSVCVPAMSCVASANSFCIRYFIPCADDNGDGTCAGDSDNPNNDIENLENQFGDDPFYGDLDGDGIPNIHDRFPEGPGGTRNDLAPLPIDMSRWEEYLRRSGGAPSPIPQDVIDLVDPATADLNGDGNISFAELLAGLVFAAETHAANAPTEPLDEEDPASVAEWAEYARMRERILSATLEYTTEMLSPATLGGVTEYEEYRASLREQISRLRSFIGMINLRGLVAIFNAGVGVLHVANDVLGDLSEAFGRLGGDVNGILGLPASPEGPGGTPIEGGDPSVATPDVPGGADSSDGDPVDTWTGAYNYTVTDLSTSGFSFQRFYDSRLTSSGIFGHNWTMRYLETRLIIWDLGGTQRAVVTWGDGTSSTYDRQGPTGPFEGNHDAYGKIRPHVQQFDGEPSCELSRPGYTLRKPDGTLYYFCPPTRYLGSGVSASWLRKIVDIHGNTTAIDRDISGRPIEVVDVQGQVYSIAYDTANKLVSEITGPTGAVVSYHYDLTEGLSPTSVAGTAIATLPPPRKRELVRVDYPETVYLKGPDQISKDRASQAYSYHEDPAGFEAKPSSLLNHNLRTITNPNGRMIEIDYGETSSEFSYDRVKGYKDSDAKSTSLVYEELTPVADSYGHMIQRVSRFVFPGGDMRSYHHADDGLLLRRETHNGAFDSMGNQVDATPAGQAAQWVTTYEYNGDLRVTEERLTTSDDPLGGQRTTWSYDDQNSDRFQQGNLLTVTSHDRLNAGQSRVMAFDYDPITARAVSEIDPLGVSVTHTYAHQELALVEVQALDHIAGWGIDLNGVGGSYWGQGDLNGDGVTGGSHQRILTQLPQVARATATPGVTVPYLPQTTLRFDENGREIFRRDPSGIETHLAYTSDGLLERSTVTRSGVTREKQFAYDKARRLVAALHPDGQVSQYRYDGRRNIIETVDFPKGYTTLKIDPTVGFNPVYSDPDLEVIRNQIFHDLAGNRSGHSAPTFVAYAKPVYGAGDVVDPVELTTFTADARPATRTRRVYEGYDLTGVATWSFSYGGQRLLQETKSPSLHDGVGVKTPAITTTYTRDARGLATFVQRVDDTGTALGIEQKVYDGFGRLESVNVGVDADNNGQLDTFFYTYDGYGREFSQQSPLGDRVELDLDDNSQVLEQRVLAAGGVVVARQVAQYDALRRVIRRERFNYTHDGQLVPGGPVLEAAETGYGHGLEQVLWVVHNPGATERYTRYTYDALVRPTGQLSGLVGDPGATGARVEFDASGRMLTRTAVHNGLGVSGGINASESTWSYIYNGFGLQESVQDPEGETAFREYDASFRLVRSVDPLGRSMEYVRDSEGRVLREIESGGQPEISRTTEYEYDAEGNLGSVLDAEGIRTAYRYDGLGRRLARTFPDQTEELFAYDLAGRLSQVDKAGGVQFTYEYDALGRVKRLSATGADAPVVVDYQYDTLGNLQGISDQVGTRDPVLLLRFKTSLGHNHAEFSSRTILGSPFTRTTVWESNEHGEVSRMSFPSGSFVDYGYDSHGRLQSIDHTSGGVTTAVASLVDPYGAGFLRADLDPTAGATLFADYSPAGRIVRKEVEDSSGAVLVGGAYGYDATGNLTCRADSVGGASDAFDYDGFQRLVDWTADLSSCSSPGVGTRQVQWSYDHVNTMTQRQDSLGATVAPVSNTLNQYEDFGPETNITYNLRGEETSRDAFGFGYVWEWDALGRPYQSTVSVGGSSLAFEYHHDGLGRLVGRSAPGSEVVYGYAGGELIEGFDLASGFKEYINGPHGIWRYRVLLDERLYLHVDPFHNVEAVHDGASVVEKYRYDPYGVPRVGSGSAWTELFASSVGNDLLFASAPYLFDLKQSRLGARFYDPLRGGFTSRDPLGEAESTNLYAYAYGNPFKFWDPSGLGGQPTQESPSDRNAEEGAGGPPSWLRFRRDAAFRAVDTFAQNLNLIGPGESVFNLSDTGEIAGILLWFDGANQGETEFRIAFALEEFSEAQFQELGFDDAEHFSTALNAWAQKISDDIAAAVYQIEASTWGGRLQQVTEEVRGLVDSITPDELAINFDIDLLVVSANMNLTWEIGEQLTFGAGASLGLTTVGTSLTGSAGWKVPGGTGFGSRSFGASAPIGPVSIGASVDGGMFRISAGPSVGLTRLDKTPFSNLPAPFSASYTHLSGGDTLTLIN